MKNGQVASSSEPSCPKSPLALPPSDLRENSGFPLHRNIQLGCLNSDAPVQNVSLNQRKISVSA